MRYIVLLVFALMLPVTAQARHLTSYVAYCYHPENPRMVRLAGVLITDGTETLMKWTPDRTKSRKQQRATLESRIEAVEPEWENHTFLIKKKVVGACFASGV